MFAKQIKCSKKIRIMDTNQGLLNNYPQSSEKCVQLYKYNYLKKKSNLLRKYFHNLLYIFFAVCEI